MKAVLLSILLSFIMISCNKIDIQASVNKTAQLIQEGKFREAEETITPCLDAARKNPRVLVLLALATSGLKDKENTLLHVDEALSLLEETTDSEALTHLGQAYINIGEFQKAQSILEKSYKIDSKNTYTVTLLIEAELNQFKTLRQYSLNNKYLKLAANYPELKNSINYLNLTAITNALGPNFNQAFVIGALSQAYTREKNNRAVLLNLAYIYDQVERIPQRAIRYYELYLTAVKLLPAEYTQADKVKRRLTYLRSRN